MSTAIRWNARPSHVALALFTVLATAGSAHAQDDGRVRLLVRAGALDAAGDLQAAHILASPTNVLSYEGFGATPTVGLGIEADLPIAPLAVRVTATRSIGGTETGQWGCADQDGEPLACPAILILVPTDITTTVVTGDVVGRLRFAELTVMPTVGLAWQRSRFEWNAEPEGAFSLAPGEHTTDVPALHLALGLSVPAGPLAVTAEAGQLFTRDDEPRPTRSSFWTVGVAVPIG